MRDVHVPYSADKVRLGCIVREKDAAMICTVVVKKDVYGLHEDEIHCRLQTWAISSLVGCQKSASYLKEF